MTKEECIRLVKTQLAKFTKVVSNVVGNTDPIDSDKNLELSNSDNRSDLEDDTCIFKVPENPLPPIKTRVTRRSVRILEKRKSIVPIQSPPSPNKRLPSKRRKTTISKKVERKTIIGIITLLLI